MNVGKYAPFYFFHRFISVSLYDGVTAQIVDAVAQFAQDGYLV